MALGSISTVSSAVFFGAPVALAFGLVSADAYLRCRASAPKPPVFKKPLSCLENLPEEVLGRIFLFSGNNRVSLVSKPCQRAHEDWTLSEQWEALKEKFPSFYRDYFCSDPKLLSLPPREQAKAVLKVVSRYLREKGMFPEEPLGPLSLSEETPPYFSLEYWSGLFKTIDKTQRICSEAVGRLFYPLRAQAIQEFPSFDADWKEAKETLGEGPALRSYLQKYRPFAEKVTRLNLSECFPKLMTLPLELGCFPNLRELSASGNALFSLPSGLLARLPKLKRLDLSHNFLARIPLEELSEAPLEELCLTGNKALFFSTRRKVDLLLKKHQNLKALGCRSQGYWPFRISFLAIKLSTLLSLYHLYRYFKAEELQCTAESIAFSVVPLLLGGAWAMIHYGLEKEVL